MADEFLAMFHASYLLSGGASHPIKKIKQKLRNLNLIGGYDHSCGREGLAAS